MPRASIHTGRPDAVSLYYELHGPGDAPALVLNNGILMTTASWPLQVPVLSREFRLILYDCRGQGQSDHPESPYTMALHADDLAALLDHLRIPRAHIAGISYGGEVAQAFALAHPDRVRSLVLADTVSEVTPDLQEIIGEWLEVARTADAERFFDVTVGWNFSRAFIDTHADLLADARRRYDALDFPAVARLCESFLTSVDFTGRLREVTAPTCVLVGDQDRLKGPDHAARIHRAIPGSEFRVIAGAGHASCWERPEEFNRVVSSFLSAHP